MTYSIVARDPLTGQLGIAVQSHYFACGTAVPWAQAGVGAVATQSVVEIGYGPKGLQAMERGAPAPQALGPLLAADDLAAVRQVAMVDACGRAAIHTGPGCVGAAGHSAGDGVSVQANMVASPTVWPAMLAAYEASTEPDLAGRLLDALDAAQEHGGDVRGSQSAALVVVAAEPGPQPWDGRLVDLRVDDDRQPLRQLRRLLGVQRATASMSAVMFGGLLFAPTVADADADAAVAALAAAQDGLGDNREPSFWAAVLLAKVGRFEQARASLESARRINPGWATFAERVADAGLLTPDQLADLRG